MIHLFAVQSGNTSNATSSSSLPVNSTLSTSAIASSIDTTNTIENKKQEWLLTFKSTSNDLSVTISSLNSIGNYTIGRSESCTWVIPSHFSDVSKIHAAIDYSSDLQMFLLRDLGSSQGTFRNGERLPKGSQIKSLSLTTQSISDSSINEQDIENDEKLRLELSREIKAGDIIRFGGRAEFIVSGPVLVPADDPSQLFSSSSSIALSSTSGSFSSSMYQSKSGPNNKQLKEMMLKKYDDEEKYPQKKRDRENNEEYNAIEREQYADRAEQRRHRIKLVENEGKLLDETIKHRRSGGSFDEDDSYSQEQQNRMNSQSIQKPATAVSMMERMGWVKGEGLGLMSKGSKRLVADLVQNNDGRKGLGS